jgi:geranylgeranyl pyrophosphate synthase
MLQRSDLTLRNEITRLFSTLPEAAGLKATLYQALAGESQPPFSLKSALQGWPLLPLRVCESISGDFEPAIPVAAALYLLKSAAEVLDDVEDGDSSVSLVARHGMPLAVNAASLLIVLAEKALTRLPAAGVASDVAVEIVDLINSYYSRACAGQYLDFRWPAEKRLTEQTYLKLVALKSAFAVECACRAGAMAASHDPQLAVDFGRFGKDLGTAYQIANDIQGIVSRVDIVKRKQTLPVIYALSRSGGKDGALLQLYFSPRYASASLSSDQVGQILSESGALYYAAVRLEYFKVKAARELKRLERYRVETAKLADLVN